jgi:hypothetical protein
VEEKELLFLCASYASASQRRPETKQPDSNITNPSDFPMVSFGRLFDKMLILGHRLLIREGDTIYALETLVVRITQEIRGRVLLGKISSVRKES